MLVAKKQKKPRRWKGKLAQKIRPQVDRPLDLCAIKDIETLLRANRKMDVLHQEAIEKEYNENLSLLMEHYGVASDDFRGLAIQLAKELGIPAFQVEGTLFEIEDGCGLVDPGNKEGRPAEWTLKRLLDLVIAVEETKEEGGTDRKALENLAAARPKEWGAPPKHRGDWIKTLQNRLGKGKQTKRFIHRQVDKYREIIEELKRENPGN